MKNLYESLAPVITILEEQKVSNAYNYILSFDYDYKHTPADELEDLTCDKYVDIICKMVSSEKRVFGIALNKDDEFRDFVRKAYNEWENTYSRAKNKIPFRINKNHQVKISKAYIPFCQRVRDSSWKYHGSRMVGGVRITIGEGLGGGQGGMQFEKEVFGAICQYMAMNCTTDNVNVDRKLLNVLHQIDKSTGPGNAGLRDKLFKAAENYGEKIKTDSLSDQDYVNRLASLIKSTGTGDVKRHIEDIIPDGDIPRDDQDMKSADVEKLYAKTTEVLKKSGDTIADITVFNPADNETIYISVKEDKAQLSGVVVSPSKKGVNWMDKVLGDMDDISDDSTMEFRKFWSMMGINPSTLKRIYKTKINGAKDPDSRARISIPVNKGNSPALGDMIQRLIGGNYWYVSPDKCIFIPVEPMRMTFKADEAWVSGTGKTINIKGKLNGTVDMTLIVRTSGGRQYPNRMFPKVDVEQLLSLKGEEI